MSTFMPITVGQVQGDNHDTIVPNYIAAPSVVREVAREKNAPIAVRVTNLNATHAIGVFVGSLAEPGLYVIPTMMGNEHIYPSVQPGKTEVFALQSPYCPVGVIFASELPENTKPGWRIEWGVVI